MSMSLCILMTSFVCLVIIMQYSVIWTSTSCSSQDPLGLQPSTLVLPLASTSFPMEMSWYMGSDQYVKEAIRNVTVWLEQRGEKPLKSKVSAPFPSNYQAELDTSPLCDDEDTKYYMQQIGVLKWAVELGRIDIAAEVSILSS
jgi:hypothetical protein